MEDIWVQLSHQRTSFSQKPGYSVMVGRCQYDRLQNPCSTSWTSFGSCRRSQTEAAKRCIHLERSGHPPLVSPSYTKTPRAPGLLQAPFKGCEQGLHKPVLRDLPRPVSGAKDPSTHSAAVLRHGRLPRPLRAHQCPNRLPWPIRQDQGNHELAA
jgi:hypothetical protein